jgi:hypothetical protein
LFALVHPFHYHLFEVKYESHLLLQKGALFLLKQVTAFHWQEYLDTHPAEI